MIVERLEVKHFRRVRDADLALGAGLNVIHGPNDLGKSTLAEAVRAALLLRSNAKEAERLIPWDDAEAQPFVRLTFRDADGVRWRVQKRFGRSGAKGSLLERDERGQWSVAAKGREVDGVLRERFRLGLPQPGGRGGPRGIPDTFLARALLGHQGEAIQLFGSGVEGDPDDSGRAWLEETMASYARDETFDRVLQEARAKVAEAYTAKGTDYRWEYTFQDMSPSFRATPLAHYFAELFTERNDLADVETIIYQFEAMLEPEPDDHFAGIACPTIILTGSEDSAHQHAFALQDRISDCELKVLPGAGHACQLEQPWLFDRFIIDFLTEQGLFPGS